MSAPSPPEKKPSGMAGWCVKCGHVLREDGTKARTHLWPKNSLVRYRGKWLCNYHYNQAVRAKYKEEWKAEELESYQNGEGVSWQTDVSDKD